MRGGVWSAQSGSHHGGVLPCGEMHRYRLSRHDYCFAPSREYRTPPPEQTAWLRGLTLWASEKHTSNFNHFNRDLLFVSRALRLHREGGKEVGLPSSARLVVQDDEPLQAWSLEQLRALVPPELRAETLWVVGGTRKSSRRAQAAKLALSSARLPAARFVCFEAIAQKLHVYPGDRDDAAEVRRRALAHCGLSPGAARHVLLEERVGGSRRLNNSAALSRMLSRLASRMGLPLRRLSFGRLGYCEQVRVVSEAAIFVGVHGQGMTNAIFIPPQSLVVELFHTSQSVAVSTSRAGQDADVYLGHQPLAVARGMHYLAAAVATAPCSFSAWKFDAACPSHIDLSRLSAALSEYAALMASHVRTVAMPRPAWVDAALVLGVGGTHQMKYE